MCNFSIAVAAIDAACSMACTVANIKTPIAGKRTLWGSLLLAAGLAFAFVISRIAWTEKPEGFSIQRSAEQAATSNGNNDVAATMPEEVRSNELVVVPHQSEASE